MDRQTSIDSWLQNSSLFIKELESGHKWAQYAAEYLFENGIDARCGSLVIRDSIDDRHAFHNEKDITFCSMPGVIEVKSRRLSFGSSPNSYPKDSAFVDTVNGWKRKDPKPLAVVLVSQITKHMLVIPTSTSPKWKTFASRDRVRGIEDTWITADRSLLRPISELIDWLLARQDKYRYGRPGE